MFDKCGERFITSGIQSKVPKEVQFFLWQLIDESKWEKDYLQIFELHKNGSANKLIIVHHQEEPSQKQKVVLRFGDYIKETFSVPPKVWVIDDGNHQTMLLPEEY